jgi:hypothetical protein
MIASDIPPFHGTGDPDGHFFALAFARGRYVSPSGATNQAAFLVLYFSRGADFAPFSLITVSTEGERLSYHRGDDHLRTVEFALLQAQQLEGVATGVWTLYPRDRVVEGEFTDRGTAEAYWEQRRRLCMVLYGARAMASAASQFGAVSPLFRHDGPTRDLYDGEPDNEEVLETMQALLSNDGGSDSEHV